MKSFKETSEKTLQNLKVDLKTGLSEEQIKQNLIEYGANEFTKGKQKSFFIKLIEALREPMVLILIVAGLIALAVNLVEYYSSGHAEFIECIGIFVAIFISVSITIVMEGRSAKAFEALNKIKDDISVKVTRGGRMITVPQQQLVVGDIVHFETGDKIPADGRLIYSTALNVDESALTGESMAVKKNADAIFEDNKTPVAERLNMLYSGCFVTGGSGTMVVTEVGDSTEFGNIARELANSEKGSTPLQEKLAKLGQTITILSAILSGIVFLIQLARFFISGEITFEAISEAFITSIVLIVASVPEGLPTIVAVSLAINVIKMSKQNALVKKMVACETVGSINVICSDKTGTLTKNRMTVTDIYTNGKMLKPSELHYDFLTQNFCINSTANVEVENGKQVFIGNPTECAMIAAFEQSDNMDKSYKKVREEAKIAFVYPFSSEIKSMTTVTFNNDGYVAYSKGSPEKILSFCDKVHQNGQMVEVSEEIIKQIEDKIMEFQQKAYRVLGFSHKEFYDEVSFEHDKSKVESKMVFDGFIAIHDPLRDDVYDAAMKCRQAGISIKMLTGDNIVTARAIATELGILNENSLVVVAKEIEELPEDEFLKIIPKISVIARSTPVIKMRVVNALKHLGNVVAVTGDGINDAPAIKNADVGVAMGITGTEVSKEASDIVLLDDSFATIVKAVHWGRGIYENFQRFIQFQLTVNLSSVIVVFLSIIFGFKAPFTALQLLWINIIMDGPPALTLGLEPITNDLMDRKPTKRDANIVTKNMLYKIILNGVIISGLFMLQTTMNVLGGTKEQLPTILFTLFVVFQLFNAFNSRELGKKSILVAIHKNKLMLLVFFCTFALQVVITQFGGAVFRTVPLPLDMWIKILLYGFTIIIASELYKIITYKRADK